MGIMDVTPCHVLSRDVTSMSRCVTLASRKPALMSRCVTFRHALGRFCHTSVTFCHAVTKLSAYKAYTSLKASSEKCHALYKKKIR
jgi:hypothetical protein